MKITIRSAAIAALLFGYAGSAAAADWQYWSTWSAAHDISDKEQVAALTEAYFSDGVSRDYVYDEYVSYSRKLGSGFNLLGQAYFESVRQAANTWAGTRSAVAGLGYTKDIPGAFTVKAEGRFFYRLSSPSKWDYYRPRLYLIRDIGPVKLTLSDELRVDLTGRRTSGFYRNRLYAMVSVKASKSLTVGLGYLCQSDKVKDDWKSFNGVQSLVAVNF